MTHRARPWFQLAALISLATLAGCSTLAINGPPKSYQPSEPPQCGGSKAWVVMDGLFGGLLVLPTAITASEGDGGAFILGAGAVGLIASAVWGSKKRARCAKAREAHHVELAARRQQLDEARRAPPARPGSLGGACYPNATCDRGLHCGVSSQTCLAGELGTVGAPCYPNRTCDPGLSCARELCVRTTPGVGHD